MRGGKRHWSACERRARERSHTWMWHSRGTGRTEGLKLNRPWVWVWHGKQFWGGDEAREVPHSDAAGTPASGWEPTTQACRPTPPPLRHTHSPPLGWPASRPGLAHWPGRWTAPQTESGARSVRQGRVEGVGRVAGGVGCGHEPARPWGMHRTAHTRAHATIIVHHPTYKLTPSPASSQTAGAAHLSGDVAHARDDDLQGGPPIRAQQVDLVQHQQPHLAERRECVGGVRSGERGCKGGGGRLAGAVQAGAGCVAWR